jgi:hypothetical protein
MEPLMPPVNVLVEGVTDEAVARRLLDQVGLRCGTVYGKEGKGALVRRSDSLRRCVEALQRLRESVQGQG